MTNIEKNTVKKTMSLGDIVERKEVDITAIRPYDLILHPVLEETPMKKILPSQTGLDTMTINPDNFICDYEDDEPDLIFTFGSRMHYMHHPDYQEVSIGVFKIAKVTILQIKKDFQKEIFPEYLKLQIEQKINSKPSSITLDRKKELNENILNMEIESINVIEQAFYVIQNNKDIKPKKEDLKAIIEARFSLDDLLCEMLDFSKVEDGEDIQEFLKILLEMEKYNGTKWPMYDFADKLGTESSVLSHFLEKVNDRQRMATAIQLHNDVNQNTTFPLLKMKEIKTSSTSSNYKQLIVIPINNKYNRKKIIPYGIELYSNTIIKFLSYNNLFKIIFDNRKEINKANEDRDKAEAKAKKAEIKAKEREAVLSKLSHNIKNLEASAVIDPHGPHGIELHSNTIIKPLSYKNLFKITVKEIDKTEKAEIKAKEREAVLSELSHNIKNLVAKAVIDPLDLMIEKGIGNVNIVNKALRGANLIREIVNSMSLSYRGNHDSFLRDLQNPDSKALSFREVIESSLRAAFSNMLDGKYFRKYYSIYYPNKDIQREARKRFIELPYNDIDALVDFASKYLLRLDCQLDDDLMKIKIGNTNNSAIKLIILFQELFLNAVKNTAFIPMDQRFLKVYIKPVVENTTGSITVKISNSFDNSEEGISRIGTTIVNNFLKQFDAKEINTDTHNGVFAKKFIIDKFFNKGDS